MRLTTETTRGQILVETAIALPIAIFMVLGGLQLMLIQHGRTVTEYAAFCAARAGIVNNANWNVMRNAALVASLPLYGRTDRLDTFAVTWSRTQAAARMTGAVDGGDTSLANMSTALLGVGIGATPQSLSLIDVEVTSPDALAFVTAQAWQQQREVESVLVDPQSPLVYPQGEIDFDDANLVAAHPEVARLAVNVRVLYPLRIPLVGRVIFELWALTAYFGGTRWAAELPTLRAIADGDGVYLVPLRASYAMQMQSNAFAANRREPAWFGP